MSLTDPTLAEQAVLACVLSGDPVAWKRASSMLVGYEFADARNAAIWREMKWMAERGQRIDLVSLSAHLDAKGNTDEVGGTVYVAGLLDIGSEPDNVESYARIVVEHNKRENLVATIDAMKIALTHGKQTDDVIAVLGKQLKELVKRDTARHVVDAETLVEINDKEIKRAIVNRGTLPGLPTGFRELDQLTGGLQKTDLILVAARPSQGKSAFAISMAHAQLQKNYRVFFVSLEMSANQVGMRFRSMDSGVDLQRIRMGYLNEQEQTDLEESAERMRRWHLFVEDTSRLTCDDIYARASKLHYSQGIDVLVLDYVQILGSRRGGAGENRVQEVSRFSADLKSIGKELCIPVVALSQLSRRVEQREENEPVLSDLKESSGLEEAADLVLMLHRSKDIEIRDKMCDVIIAKARNGPTGRVSLGWRGPQAQFVNIVQVRE